MLRHIPLYGQTTVCLSVIWSWTPGLLCVLATLNNAAVNTGVQIPPWNSALSSLRYICANGIPRLEDEMVGWHHWRNGHELEQTLGDGEGQRSLACSTPQGRKESDMTWRLNIGSAGSRATAVLLSAVAAPASSHRHRAHWLSSPAAFTSARLLFLTLVSLGCAGSSLLPLQPSLCNMGSRYNWGVQTLCCGLWDPVPWREMESGPPVLGSWSLSHWTTSVVPPWCCLFSVLLMVPFLTDVRWCLVVVLIFVPVMVSDVQHLFSSCWPFLWRNVYSSFSPTLNWVVLLLSFRSSLTTQHIRYTICKYFLIFWGFFPYFVCGDKIIKFSWTPICFLFCCMFCCCSVDKLCWTLCNPVDWGTPGFPVLHYLPEFAQTHVPWICDAIQPSHSLSPPFSGPQSFPASGSFLMSQFFASDGQSIGALASVLPMNI